MMMKMLHRERHYRDRVYDAADHLILTINVYLFKESSPSPVHLSGIIILSGLRKVQQHLLSYVFFSAKGLKSIPIIKSDEVEQFIYTYT